MQLTTSSYQPSSRTSSREVIRTTRIVPPAVRNSPTSHGRYTGISTSGTTKHSPWVYPGGSSAALARRRSRTAAAQAGRPGAKVSVLQRATGAGGPAWVETTLRRPDVRSAPRSVPPTTRAPATLRAAGWGQSSGQTPRNLEAAEYKHVVLGSVFLKYVSDAFIARRTTLETMLSDPDSPDHISSADRRDRSPGVLESSDEYTSENVFGVPAAARWDVLLRDAKQATIGQTIDAAMDLGRRRTAPVGPPPGKHY